MPKNGIEMLRAVLHWLGEGGAQWYAFHFFATAILI